MGHDFGSAKIAQIRHVLPRMEDADHCSVVAARKVHPRRGNGRCLIVRTTRKDVNGPDSGIRLQNLQKLCIISLHHGPLQRVSPVSQKFKTSHGFHTSLSSALDLAGNVPRAVTRLSASIVRGPATYPDR